MRDGCFEDVQHTVTGFVPYLWAELLPVQNDYIFQTVGP